MLNVKYICRTREKYIMSFSWTVMSSYYSDRFGSVCSVSSIHTHELLHLQRSINHLARYVRIQTVYGSPCRDKFI